MGKDFLKLKTGEKRFHVLIIVVGILLTVMMAVRSFRDTVLEEPYGLVRNNGPAGEYDQELVARIEKEEIPITVTVDEKILTEEEAKAEFQRAEQCIPKLLTGENVSLMEVRTDLNFITQAADTQVKITWTDYPQEYFYSDGKLKEEIEVSEPVELELSAILSCQEYVKDYDTSIVLFPKTETMEEKLQKMIRMENQENADGELLILPKTYQGKQIIWKKPLDRTFLYFLFLTAGTVVFLKLGGKRDEQERKKERLAELERDYPQIVSKFAMLLSAGLSVRNAWERIVMLQRRKQTEPHTIDLELAWGLKEMQKGVSELEIYEKIGVRIGQVYYKKLMALFISDRRRGSVKLLDAMNQEMLAAFDEQKRRTRQIGEQIGSKLLIPMMGMLGVVFTMILVPAFLSFQL